VIEKLSSPEPCVREAFAQALYFALTGWQCHETQQAHWTSALAHSNRLTDSAVARGLRQAADLLEDWPLV
jgi:hypothetical protein